MNNMQNVDDENEKNYSKVVKLKRAKKYPTYQFYAEMDNKNIDLKDGLKIAALTCLSWLRGRFEEDDVTYKELEYPKEKDYKKIDTNQFKSFVIEDGYKVQVLSMFDEGMWSLKIEENDSGSLEGRTMVPGRTITSDIGFKIVGDKLECGFRVIIKDLMDVELADCIRYSVIKQLGFNEKFGFKQITNLNKQDRLLIKDDEALKHLKGIINSKENQLPIVLYIYEDGLSNIPNIKDLSLTKSYIDFNELSDDKQKEIVSKSGSQEEDVVSKAIPHLNKYYGYGRVYHVPVRLVKEIEKIINVSHIKQNTMVVITPDTKVVKRFNYEDDNDKKKASEYVKTYYRKKEYDYHDIVFYDELNEYYQNKILNDKDYLIKNLQEKINQYIVKDSQQNRKERKENYVPGEDINDELEQVKKILNRIRDDNSSLNKQVKLLKDKVEKKDLIIDYYRRKDNYPKTHKEIAKWANDNFKFVILNRKAIDCLNRNDAENVDVKTICEALDYLENVYSQKVFSKISDGSINNMSSIIYNRPYEVTPSGIPVSCKGDCKIKYAFDGEKNREHILDQHLKVGAHGELIRIYFIIDKLRKKIVIGSLPNHLKY